MDCRVVLAAFALATLTIVCLPCLLAAQTPGPANNDLIDPPDTVYHTGAIAEDPVVERRRAIVPPHRAFLPVVVDLSSRMPAVAIKVARRPARLGR